MAKRLTQEDFVKRAKEIFGDLYGYEEAIYTGSKIKVKIYCRQCKKNFFIQPANHINQKQGCKACGMKRAGEKNRLTKEEMISKFKKVHGDKYDYSQTFHPKNQKKRY